MSNEIIKVLDMISHKFGLVIDWSSKNVFPYSQQLYVKYIRYELVTSIIWLIGGLGFVGFGVYSFKKFRSELEQDEEMEILWFVLLIISLVIGTVVSFTGISNILTCLTFPEKLILNELKSIYSSIN
jgi:hypothetical protein